MTDDTRDDEKPVEHLRRVYQEAVPVADLEDRVVRALADRGALRPAARFRGVWPMGIAATMLLAFGAGWGASRWSRDGGDAPGADQRWVMLLYRIPDGNAHEAERVSEYRAWAGKARASGVNITGERLGNEGWALSGTTVGASQSDSLAVTGYFLLEASSPERALDIARTCPHLRHGGRVELKKIAPT